MPAGSAARIAQLLLVLRPPVLRLVDFPPLLVERPLEERELVERPLEERELVERLLVERLPVERPLVERDEVERRLVEPDPEAALASCFCA